MSLPFLGQRLFNTPLALHPDKAEVVVAALADRLGVTRLLRPDADLAADLAFDLGDEVEGGAVGLYQLVDGVAVIPVCGTLVHKSAWLTPTSGLTGYNGVRLAFRTALIDTAARAIAFDIDSGGGECSGLFDLIDEIHAARDEKPVWAILSENAYSAAYGIASACDVITVPRTGGTGSVGVIYLHVEFSKALVKEGLTPTLFTFGDRKGDGHPAIPLPAEAVARFQADVDAIGDLFVETVARNRGMAVADVRATQAATYLGQQGVEVGFADVVMSPGEALQTLARAVALAA